MNLEKINDYIGYYKSSLLEDTMPFWTKRCLDEKFGGYLTYFDREGNILSTEKSGWVQGRMVWMFSKLYNEVEKKAEWLKLARSGYEFLRDHILNDEGRCWFTVRRDGTPIRRRRYLFVETFAIIGCAEYYKAAGDKEALNLSKKILNLIYRLREEGTDPKFHKSVEFKGHSMTMILISVLQIMRSADPGGDYDHLIKIQIDEIFRDFIHSNKKCLLETVGLKGEFLDTPVGRTVNPGHAIETVWFILEEAIHQNNQELIKKILPVLKWHLELGWDKEHGGIKSFVDCSGNQPEQIEWNMKYWWPHNEALYATLLAYHLTREEEYSKWFETIHQWSDAHFPDKEYGEWFGYLNYDGTVSSTLKGNNWKSCFHLPRQQLLTWQLLEKMKWERSKKNK